MTPRRAWLAGLVALLCLDLCLLQGLADLDIWARLAVGEFALAHGGPPARDPFSYTATRPFIDHEWGAGLLFYLVARAGGQAGLILLRAGLFVATLAALHLALRARVARPESLLFHLALVGGLAFAFAVTVRSQAFTYFFFALWLWLLERMRRGSHAAWWVLPPTAALWANLHGGFLSGIGLIVIYAAGAFLERRPWRSFAALAALAGYATVLNPYGPRYWVFLAEAVTMQRPDISEWRPIDLLGPPGDWTAFKLFLLASGLCLAVRTFRARPAWTDVGLLGITACLGLRHARHAPFLVIAAAPFLYESLRLLAARLHSPAPAPSPSPSAPPSPLRVARLSAESALTLAAGVWCAAFLPPAAQIPDWYLPVDAVDFIRTNRLTGRLLVPFEWGSFALWKLYPQCRVSMDGRFEECYDTRTYLDMRRFFNAQPGWEQVLDRYPPDLILVPTFTGSAAAMPSLPDWIPIHEDVRARVYVPTPRAAGPWVAPDPARRAADPFALVERTP